MRFRTSGWAALAVCATALTAGASTTLLSDGFEGDTPAEGKTDLVNWSLGRGSVDVLASGEFGVTGRGNFVDMDGTDTFAGELVSKQSFALTPGAYTLSFDVGGSMRDSVTAANTMVVSLGDVFSTTVTKNFNDPFETLTFPITVTTATSGNLVFDHQGGDLVGLLLDNVVLTGEGAGEGPVPIPLPAAAWAGMTALGAIALVGRVRRARST